MLIAELVILAVIIVALVLTIIFHRANGELLKEVREHLAESKKLEDLARKLIAESEAIDKKVDEKLKKAEALKIETEKILADALMTVQEQVS